MAPFPPLLLLVGSLMAIAAICVLALITRKQKPVAKSAEATPPPAAGPRGARRGAGTAAEQLRAATLRRRGRAAPAAEPGDAAGDGSDEEDEDASDVPSAAGGTRAQRLAARKAAKRAEKEAARVAREEGQAAETEEPKISNYEEARRAREQAREEAEAEEAAEMQRIANEKQAEIDREAAKWMSQISVAEEGDGGAAAEAENGQQLSRFVDYIRAQKCVVLEELAAQFGLTTADAIQRVQDLDRAGDVSGVMDDRGKFIYVSREEMQAVADFMKQKGRVSIRDLAAEAGNLVDLEGSREAAPEMDIDLDEA